MESRLRLIITLRWIQWVLGAFSFGVCLAYFLTDVNFYLWIPTVFRAQVGLSGFLHLYLYLAAIWVSVKPQGPLVWAILDIIFAIIAAAVAGTGQPSISEYCSSSSLTLYWSDAYFAYVPLDQRASSDSSTMSEVISSSYLQRACGLNAGVLVASGLLVILFATTAILQFREHRDVRRERNKYLTEQEKLEQQQVRNGFRHSLLAPFGRQRLNLEA